MALHSEVGIPEDAVAEFCKRNNLSDIPHKDIARFCERNHIKTLATFDADTRERHNIGGNDLYASFERGYEHKPKSGKLCAMQDELSEVLGVSVRLKTRHELSNWIIVAFFPTELLYHDYE